MCEVSNSETFKEFEIIYVTLTPPTLTFLFQNQNQLQRETGNSFKFFYVYYFPSFDAIGCCAFKSLPIRTHHYSLLFRWVQIHTTAKD